MFNILCKNYNNKLVQQLVFANALIIAVSNWLVNYRLDIFGNPVALSAFTFPLIIVLTDITVRLIGKDLAKSVIGFSFIPAIIVSIIAVIGIGVSYTVALRIGVASGIAYLIGNMLDVTVFQYFREKYQAWFVAPTLSSIVASIIDTYVFFGSAFYKSADEFMRDNWLHIANDHIIIKTVISLFIVLPLYGLFINLLLTKFKKENM